MNTIIGERTRQVRAGRQRHQMAQRMWQERWRAPWFGYFCAFVGVVGVSLVIALVQAQTPIANISLLYLVAVLWVAVSFGRGSAICAALLAFLADDLFFIPPFYRLTVDDPNQWLSLFTLLATALVAGQLTAAARARAQEAQESRQYTETLYALAQLIATATDDSTLLTTLAQWGSDSFALAGVRACAILQTDVEGALTLCALTPANSSLMPLPDEETILRRANQALTTEQPINFSLPTGDALAGDSPSPACLACIPLRSNRQIVGALGLIGSEGMVRLIERQANLGDDQLASLFGAYRDQLALTLERAALRRQAIHTEALRESDRLKTALLESVTHDLRTPLAGIKAAVTSLLAPTAQRSLVAQHELLAAINTSADRLNRLVSNLLDLSRLEAGVAKPHLEWYTIDEVIVAALDTLERAGQLDARRIVVETPDDLPLALMDHDQIERVMINLVENALKYSPAQGVIHIAARVIRDELETRVSDEGIGVTPGELTAIFEKFYRGQQPTQPGASRMAGGVGLGLSICASIIHAHQGRIWAESQPGHGATFIFTLPLSPERPLGELPELPGRTETLALPA